MTTASVAGFTVALLAGAVVGCAGTHGDPAARRLCRDTNFSQVDDHGVTFTIRGHPRLLAGYASTGTVLNTWDPTNQEHPTFSMWRSEADGRLMAACFFDGSFRSGDGRSYARVLIETDGHRYQLIVADKRSGLPTSRPPRG